MALARLDSILDWIEIRPKKKLRKQKPSFPREVFFSKLEHRSDIIFKNLKFHSTTTFKHLFLENDLQDFKVP